MLTPGSSNKQQTVWMIDCYPFHSKAVNNHPAARRRRATDIFKNWQGGIAPACFALVYPAYSSPDSRNENELPESVSTITWSKTLIPRISPASRNRLEISLSARLGVVSPDNKGHGYNLLENGLIATKPS